jgi:YD repeat-containing protein
MPLGNYLRCAPAVVVVFLLAPRFAISGTTASSTSQQATANSTTSISDNSEAASAPSKAATLAPAAKSSARDKAGLRGDVEECSLEMITPASPTSPIWRMAHTYKYDHEGRILQSGYVNNDGSKGTETFTYDSHGHLLTSAWDAPAGGATSYSYDAQGRLTGITGKSDLITTFEYDDQGRKTRIVKSLLNADSTRGRAPSGSSFDGDDLSMTPPAGGMVKTSFNERDQATEAQMYTASGELAARMTRAYDSHGHVRDESYVIENIMSVLPPETQRQVSADRLASAALLTRLEVMQRSYAYDGEGRVVEKRERTGFARDEMIKITYNDHGDEIEEISTPSGDPNSPESEDRSKNSSPPPRPPPDEQSDVRFSYHYDSFGNWIEKITSVRSDENEPFRISSTERRTITYY